MTNFYVTSVKDCPHCENGAITPLEWQQCHDAMRKASTWNNEAIIAWFNANTGGSYESFDDLPEEEIGCPDCECTGRIENKRVPLEAALKELGY